MRQRGSGRKTLGALLVAACAFPAVLLAAQDSAPFDFDPVPRWPIPANGEDHDTDVACKAIVRECPDLAPFGDIQREMDYDELYDKDGLLVGIHMTRSTGCKPLDEHLLLGQHRFRMIFRRAGEPDLDGMRLSLAPGVNPDDVRIVRSTGTSASLGC